MLDIQKYTRRWPEYKDFDCPECGQPYIDDGVEDVADEADLICAKCGQQLHIHKVISVTYIVTVLQDGEVQYAKVY